MAAATAWLGTRAYAAQDHLQQARELATQFAAASMDGDDDDALRDKLAALAEEASAARSLTSDGVWRAAETLPWIGPQLRAVSTVSAGLDEIVTALEPLVGQVSDVGLEAFAPRDGAIDTDALIQLQGSASEAAEQSAEALRVYSHLDPSLLIPALREPFEQAAALSEQVAGATDVLARATLLLPPMLGADGPRDYLVLFQNNAEWRSLGGLVGSLALVHTEDGRFSLTGQGSGGGLGYYPEPPIAFDDEVLAIYGTRPGRYPANVTQLPDFTLGAPLAREFWQQTHGDDADGVIAVDPVALSYILEVTGPVSLPTGDTLTAENVVQLVLNEVYLRYDDPLQQNEFFEIATAAVFQAISTRSLDPIALIGALGQASAENRVFIWSSHDDEQAILDGTSLQGKLPVTDADTTRFGVYLNDGTGSKLDYYMRTETAASWCTTHPDGTGEASLRVTLQNDAPADIGEYTKHITGGGNYGVTPGTTRTVAYIYLPEGAEPMSVTAGDGASVGSDIHENRIVYTWETNLLPGESTSIDIGIRAPSTEGLEVVHTATLDGEEAGDDAVSPCEVAP
ncbi:DUF4012 domain-containing protein [Microbacterium sp. LRZ72]|uniref:DUF4012 domain-containing protein n=1 Tax=Microbacterium sp. LRZ72 TaxID=2942481 RepID=UPI0029A0F613|nr:DUF4012 domain-containing protein [Microbacterium sp. LRZ72]MDX2377627.1 DUF4012 domain-containing protein [Microbacterium sp. LRZ72]